MNPDKSEHHKPIGRQKFDHEVPSWVSEEACDFFVTICCQRRGTNQLCLPLVSAALLDAARFYHHTRKWFPAIFLLMPDHLHMIVSFGHDQSMPSVVKNWKRITAKETGVVWQDGFFEHRLRGNESWEEKATYIFQNPVRAGLVERVEDWPHVLTLDEFTGEERARKTGKS